MRIRLAYLQLAAVSLFLFLSAMVGCDQQARQIKLDNGIQVGSPAPEISGVDLDGASMNLSEFRGKVVLLDFFGHW